MNENPSTHTEYVIPTLVPLFSTDEDQDDGILEANDYNAIIASSFSITKD